MSDDRARWRVNERSFIGHTIVTEGDEVFYTPSLDKAGNTQGVSANLSPLNDAAQAIVEEQARDHPDKSANGDKRAKAAAAKAAAEALAAKEASDGKVTPGAAKGDQRTKKADKPVKAAAAAKTEPPADDKPDDGDIA